MSDIGNVETMLAGIPDQDLRKILKRVFEYVLTDTRFGRAEDGERSKNFGGGFFAIRTAENAGDEFIIPHSFGRPPYLLLGALPLDAVNATLVPLTITRAADANNVYLSSTEEDTPIVVYLEG